MPTRAADDEPHIQEAQYKYPYHYIPRVADGCFSQLQYWSWGMHYLGGMEVVLNQINSWTFDSLVDVGCGDGRFLRELAAERPAIDTLGIDVVAVVGTCLDSESFPCKLSSTDWRIR